MLSWRLLGQACACVALLSLGAAAEAKRPNVLFVFSDDQRADAIAALGNSRIKTPHLDALARSGMVFRNAYCLGANSGAVCTPSRNMLLSGRAYFRFQGLAEADKPNFPASMQGGGYVTYHHGKRGNTALPIQALFEHNRYVKEDESRRSGEAGKEIVDGAIEFFKQDRAGKPFFMYLALETPHDPRVATAADMGLYERDQIPLPKNFLPLHPFDNGELLVRDERLAAWPRSEAEVREHLHEYYAVITQMDRQIGRLLAALKATGEYENTYIVYSSDHGLAVGSHGLMGKQSLYEHSMKVPLIFAGPGIAPGETPALCYLLDIFPTVCDLVGAKIPAGLDGQSLKPVLVGEAKQARKQLFLSYRNVQRAIRDDRYKLIRYPQINRTQLFDLASDPEEIHDLSAAPEHEARREALLTALAKQQAHFGDAQPLSVANPRSAEFVPPAREPRPQRKP